jgi:UDP-N-acetylmuramate-alanine ligase
MSALACYLYDLGNIVKGSDMGDYQFNKELMKRRIEVYDFDTYEFINDYIYIIGNAYNEEFSEVQKIIRNKYEYYCHCRYSVCIFCNCVTALEV